MPYFKDNAGGLHFLSADDVAAGFKSVLPEGVEQIDDAEAIAIQAPTPTARDIALTEILALESSITPRRLREAAIGEDGGWLKAVNDRIAALRSSLVEN